MAASINASTSAGVVTTADTTGNLNLQSNGTTVLAMTSAGIAVTGTQSVSAATGAFTGVQVGTGSTTNIGWILGNASSGLAGIWSTGVTPSTTNYSIRNDGGTTLYLNASTDVITRIGNVGVLDVASTGLTVTGGVTQTGAVASAFTNTGTNYVVTTTNTSASSPNGISVSYTGSDPNTNGNSFLACASTAGSKFFAFSNGGLANFSANDQNLSDLREKKNIALACSYIDKICAIPVKTFLYNDQTDSDLNLGVIAQDVEAVAPELVTESDWGVEGAPKIRKSVYQTDLQYALMKCIQEQQLLIKDLTARIAVLEAK